MATEANPNEIEEIQRGREAQSLLTHPMLESAFSAIETKCLKDFFESSPDQSELREEAYRRMRSNRTVKGLLTAVIETGKLAELKDVELPRTYEEEVKSDGE